MMMTVMVRQLLLLLLFCITITSSSHIQQRDSNTNDNDNNNNILEDTSMDFVDSNTQTLEKLMRFVEPLSAPALVNPVLSQQDPSFGCIDSPFAVCVGGGTSTLTAFAGDAVRRGLVGKWDFDDRYCQDKSGQMNYCRPAPPVGPGYDGRGASASFGSTISTTIPHQPSYSSPSLTIMFWLFINDRGSGAPRSIIRKGTTPATMAPDIQYYPETGHVHVFVATTEGPKELVSKGKIMPRRWTHVAMVQNDRVLSLFVNGVLDRQRDNIPEPHVLPNSAPLVVGGQGLSFYMDELTIHSHALLSDEIEAIGGEVYPGLHPKMVYVGCADCTLEQARRSCSETYHVCNRRELQGGAMLVVNNEGWLPLARRHIWHDNSAPSDNPKHAPTCALCCINE